MFTVAGAVNGAPTAGWVMLTLGAVLLVPSTVTILATDGTPSLPTTNSMYTPGGAMLAFAGAVAVSEPAPAAKLSGT